MPYDQLASQAELEKTLASLKPRNLHGELVGNKAEALDRIKQIIPAGKSVMTGTSTTLEQIGFVELLKSGQHPWHNLKEAIVKETNPDTQAELRRRSVLADYWLGSIHALTQDGQAVIASASGSQLPAYTYTAENVIWVVGAQKIVSNLEAALARIRDHVFPLEDARMKATGAPGSAIAKILIVEKEIMPRQIHLILVNEVLGF